jgi:hypothetical protein
MHNDKKPLAGKKPRITSTLLLRGSLIVLRRKCGKSTCHCAEGEPHETPALSYSLDGVTKMLTLREQDVSTVKSALERYRNVLAALEEEAMAGITSLRLQIESEKATRGGKKR